MEKVFNIPKFRAGYLFRNDPRFLSVDDQQAINMAGYDKFGTHINFEEGDLESSLVVDGADPNKSFLRLDNTIQGNFLNVANWQHTMVVVFRPKVLSSGTKTYTPLLSGFNSNPNLASSMQLIHFSGNRVWKYQTNSNQASPGAKTVLDDQVYIFGVCFDQENRLTHFTTDGVTTTSVSFANSTINGNAGAWPDRLTLLGYMNNDVADSTALPHGDYMDLGGLFYFGGNALVDAQPQMEAFFSELSSTFQP